MSKAKNVVATREQELDLLSEQLSNVAGAGARAGDALLKMYRPGPRRIERRTKVTEKMVDAFRQEWNQANREGDAGNRVRRGLKAALNDTSGNENSTSGAGK